jgi:hypothetical protein
MSTGKGNRWPFRPNSTNVFSDLGRELSWNSAHDAQFPKTFGPTGANGHAIARTLTKFFH